MGILTKAAGKKVESKPKSKGLVWVAGDVNGNAIAKSIHELVQLSSEAKALEAKMDIHKTVVKKYAESQYVTGYAELGVPPDGPLFVQNADGEKVTFVVQDRSGQYGVKDEQKDALVQLVGSDVADDLLYGETKFSFNRELLAVPGVLEAIEKALEGAVKKLTSGARPVLSSEQAENLVEADQKVSFKPGTLDRLGYVVGRDTGKIKQFLDIMGSSVTKYIKC